MNSTTVTVSTIVGAGIGGISLILAVLTCYWSRRGFDFGYYWLRVRDRNPPFLESSLRLTAYDTTLRHGTTLCSNCKAIPFERLFSSEISNEDLKYLYRIGRFGAQICLEIGSNNSCTFCSLVYSCLEKLDLIDSISNRDEWRILRPSRRSPRSTPGVTILNLVTVEPGLVALYVSVLLSKKNSAGSFFEKAELSRGSLDDGSDPDRYPGTNETSSIRDDETFLIQKVNSETQMPFAMSEPDSTNCVDFGMIRRWIETCMNQHNGVCDTQAWESVMQNPGNLRIIDVEEKCLVDVSGDVAFVALSYVWGGSKGSQLELNRANKQTLYIPGAFERCSDNIPLTILDTMALCKCIGQKYLWVDRLCIVQDDKTEQMEQIANMDKVYGCAILTIVAADGRTAGAGLAGVRENSRPAQSDFQRSGRLFVKPIVPSLQLLAPLGRQTFNQQEETQSYGPETTPSTIVPAIPAAVRTLTPPMIPPSLYDSPWFHRAWTFQEWVLSKRLLVFFNNQVFWHCKCSSWCEDMLRRKCNKWGFCIDSNYPPIERLNLQPEFLQVDATAGRRDGSIETRSNGSTVVVRCRSFAAYAWAVPRFAGRQLGYERDVLEAFKGISRIFGLCFRSSMFYGLPESLFDVALLWQPSEQLRRRGNEVKMPSWSWAGWIGKVRYESCYGLDDNYWRRKVFRHESEEERLRCLVCWYRIADGDTHYTPINGSGFGIASIADRNGLLPQEWTQIPIRPPSDFSIPRNRDLDQQCLYFWAAITTFQVRPAGEKFLTSAAFEVLSESGQWIGSGRFDAAPPMTALDIEMVAISEAQFFEDYEDNKDQRLIADLRLYTIYNVLLVIRDSNMGVVHRVGLGRVFKEEFKLNNPKIEWIALA